MTEQTAEYTFDGNYFIARHMVNGNMVATARYKTEDKARQWCSGKLAPKQRTAHITLSVDTKEVRAALDKAAEMYAEAASDARVLAHAYQHDSRPPPDVVERALAYRAGRGGE